MSRTYWLDLSTDPWLWECLGFPYTSFIPGHISAILRAIVNSPWYVKNHTIHSNLKFPYVGDVIHERIGKHHTKLEAHPNPLLEPLLQPAYNRRLNRCWPFDLQDTWGDIAGCTPHYVTVLRPHISLKIDLILLIANNKEEKKPLHLPHIVSWLEKETTASRSGNLLLPERVAVVLSNSHNANFASWQFFTCQNALWLLQNVHDP
jgi:hypothetical protein